MYVGGGGGSPILSAYQLFPLEWSMKVFDDTDFRVNSSSSGDISITKNMPNANYPQYTSSYTKFTSSITNIKS